MPELGGLVVQIARFVAFAISSDVPGASAKPFTKKSRRPVRLRPKSGSSGDHSGERCDASHEDSFDHPPTIAAKHPVPLDEGDIDLSQGPIQRPAKILRDVIQLVLVICHERYTLARDRAPRLE
jgi:hypothetical protein